MDISRLRALTGLITLDPGYVHTGSCVSAITFSDGEKEILRYRGISVEQLAEKATFKERAFLLIYGYLPNASQLSSFSDVWTEYSAVHEKIKIFFQNYPSSALTLWEPFPPW